MSIDEMKEAIDNMTEDEFNEFIDSLTEEELAEVEVAGLVKVGKKVMSARAPQAARAIKKGAKVFSRI